MDEQKLAKLYEVVVPMSNVVVLTQTAQDEQGRPYEKSCAFLTKSSDIEKRSRVSGETEYYGAVVLSGKYIGAFASIQVVGNGFVSADIERGAVAHCFYGGENSTLKGAMWREISAYGDRVTIGKIDSLIKHRNEMQKQKAAEDFEKAQAKEQEVEVTFVEIESILES